MIEAHELFGVVVRPDRGHRPPAVDRALDGRVHRRRHDRPALAARHAPAHRLRAGLPGADRDAVRPDRLGRRSAGWTSSRRTWTPSAASAWPTRPVALGGTAPAWLNAANEVAVEAFLDGRIGWTAIADVLEAVLARHDGAMADSVDAVIDADRQARAVAGTIIEERRTMTIGTLVRSDPTDQPGLSRGQSVARLGIVVALLLLLGLRGLVGCGGLRHRAARVDRPARARPLPRRPLGRDEGDRVLHRLRPPDLEHPAGRDRVRPQGAAPRRLREGAGHEQPRGDPAGGGGPHLPRPVLRPSGAHGLRRSGHEPADRAGPLHRLLRLPRRADHQRSRAGRPSTRRARGRRPPSPGSRPATGSCG